MAVFVDTDTVTFLKLRNRKHFPCFYRKTWGSLGEEEMLWRHEPEASVSKAFI